ncbi:MAG: S24 family peptidase [Planctomycetota bacterium]
MAQGRKNKEKQKSACTSANRFGDELRRLRRERGWTIEALALRVGVTKGYLSMIENGRVDNPPSGKVRYAIELVLGIEDDTLRLAEQWDRTPAPVREQLEATRRRAEHSERLLAELRDKTADGFDAGEVKQDSRAVDTDLDRLYRSGDLARLTGVGSGIEDAGITSFSGDTSRRQDGGRFPRVPLINKVAAGLPAGFTDLDYPAGGGEDLVHVPGYTGLHGQDDPDAFAAVIEGDSMTPDYRPGDIVVFSPLADVVDGSDCYARLEPDHETTFKRVRFERDGGVERIRLVPLNKKYPVRTVDREQVAGLYRAVWRMSRV